MLLYGKKVKQWICQKQLYRFSQLKLYEYQRSRSITDLGPNISDLIFFNFFSSLTTWPIEAKFHLEPPWDGGTKAYSIGLGHMSNMATIPIYDKKKL